MTSQTAENSSVASGLTLAAFFVACFAAASIGAMFPVGEWYAGLNRPSYAPPNWIFGPVWTILYSMMAVSAWLVWRAAGFKPAATAFVAFGVQLILNSIWSALFFGLHRPDLALIEILLLWIAIATTIWLFRKHSSVAARMLFPYLGWVSFAAFLNYGFWSLNA